MKCKESDCQSSCEKHKKCETPTGCGSCCGNDRGCSSNQGCSKNQGHDAEAGEIKTTSFSMVADCSKSKASPSDGEKKDDGLNVINDLEIHYSKLYEEQSEFFMLNKLVGITNLQQVELIETELEGCVYEQMEELICDINSFLKSAKNLSSRMTQELDVYFISSEQ